LAAGNGEPTVYHGSIRENAGEGDVVSLDKPIVIRNKSGVANGMEPLRLLLFFISYVFDFDNLSL